MVATLLGGLLLIAGLLGVPAWLVELVVTVARGGSSGRPLHAWEMCVVLAAAVPAGIALLWIATIGLPAGPYGGSESPRRSFEAASPRRTLSSNDAGFARNLLSNSGRLA